MPYGLYEMDNQRLEGLFEYLDKLEQAGLDGSQVYRKYMNVCAEIEKELDIGGGTNGIEGNNRHGTHS